MATKFHILVDLRVGENHQIYFQYDEKTKQKYDYIAFLTILLAPPVLLPFPPTPWGLVGACKRTLVLVQVFGAGYPSCRCQWSAVGLEAKSTLV